MKNPSFDMENQFMSWKINVLAWKTHVLAWKINFLTLKISMAATPGGGTRAPAPLREALLREAPPGGH